MYVLFRNLHLKCLTSCLPISTVYQGFYKNYSQIMVQLNVNEAVLMYEEGHTKFDMLLRYINPALNVDRRFNFHRSVDEPIKNLVRRMDNNIKTYIIKKSKRKKKKANKLEEKIEPNNIGEDGIKFVRNNCVLDGDLTCKTILEHSSEIKLIIFDQEYVLKQNIPYIAKMELPLNILIDFPIYLSKFETTYVNREMSTFNWYKFENKEWIHVGEGYIYIPRISDLGCRLKVSCVPRNDTQTGPVVEVTSNGIVQPGPGLCPFDIRHAFTRSKLSGKSFRITSYNILANVYSETSLSKDTLYPYCPQYALSMDYRKLLILKELIGYNADIICLQEVDSRVYKNDLLLSLCTLNYGSIFNLKNDMQEGVVTFYNEERFDKLDSDYSIISQGINLDGFNTIWSQIQNEDLKQTFLNRNTIIQNAECNVSIIYCGDFNSVPESAVYQLIIKKHILNYHDDSQSDPDPRIRSVKHDVNLHSACGTPKYTNYTTTFSGCLDYIFYQTDHLEIEQVIPMPSEEELNSHMALPSVVFPSDHISLCVDLKWSK
ncbi:2',5'-phosphodiesterase 12 isoform X3 [Megachile rotundata]|uniref:2',5'-phosphodiesterase 12 isoform X3 n=1 Tax=Megachile rotundata TaxID=143995 RepID=UPI000614C562|nr:PREDICTED: 2',5'-phosphodiesterase 12 isoform X2 [Megachile rotundata]